MQVWIKTRQSCTVHAINAEFQVKQHVRDAIQTVFMLHITVIKHSALTPHTVRANKEIATDFSRLCDKWVLKKKASAASSVHHNTAGPAAIRCICNCDTDQKNKDPSQNLTGFSFVFWIYLEEISDKKLIISSLNRLSSPQGVSCYKLLSFIPVLFSVTHQCFCLEKVSFMSLWLWKGTAFGASFIKLMFL